jgi:hypothetical protein
MIVRQLTVARLLSTLFALAYLSIVWTMPPLKKGDPNPYAYGLYVVSLCMVCIWFPDAMGSLRWYARTPLEPTPGCLVSMVAWVILVAFLMLALIGLFTGYPYR